VPRQADRSRAGRPPDAPDTAAGARTQSSGRLQGGSRLEATDWRASATASAVSQCPRGRCCAPVGLPLAPLRRHCCRRLDAGCDRRVQRRRRTRGAAVRSADLGRSFQFAAPPTDARRSRRQCPLASAPLQISTASSGPARSAPANAATGSALLSTRVRRRRPTTGLPRPTRTSRSGLCRGEFARETCPPRVTTTLAALPRW